eukprot:2698262-Pleurochrysis_carterae.AAC.2
MATFKPSCIELSCLELAYPGLESYILTLALLLVRFITTPLARKCLMYLGPKSMAFALHFAIRLCAETEFIRSCRLGPAIEGFWAFAALSSVTAAPRCGTGFGRFVINIFSLAINCETTPVTGSKYMGKYRFADQQLKQKRTEASRSLPCNLKLNKPHYTAKLQAPLRSTLRVNHY